MQELLKPLHEALEKLAQTEHRDGLGEAERVSARAGLYAATILNFIVLAHAWQTRARGSPHLSACTLHSRAAASCPSHVLAGGSLAICTAVLSLVIGSDLFIKNIVNK